MGILEELKLPGNQKKVWESKDCPEMSKQAGWDAWNNSCTPTQPWGGLKVQNELFPLVTDLEKTPAWSPTSSPGQLGKVLRAQKRC